LVSTGLIVVVITALIVPTIGASANGLPGHRLRETWSEHYIVRTIQEADARIAYSGAWARASFRDYLGGSARYSDRAGSKATLRFSGTAIAWIGPKGPTRGRANVYLNGRLVETVNTYASRFRPAQILYQATFSKPAIRTLSVVVLGTHQHPTVAVDAFIVRGVKRPQATAESTPAPMPPRATVPAATPSDTARSSTPTPAQTDAAPAATPTPIESHSTPTASPTPVDAPASPPSAEVAAPAWSDDFSSGLARWTPKVHAFDGFRVDETQVSISNGVLNLTALREVPGRYVTGSVYSDRTFDHGYFEARIKWPKGTGFDSAFWLYPEGRSTPAPEIDIIEAYPNDPYVWPGPDRYQATMHYVSGGVSRNHQITHDAGYDLTDRWHTVGAHWLPGNRLEFYFDGASIGAISADVLPATPLNIMFSQGLATWSAPPDASTPAAATMQVDWVRWYETKP